MSRGQYALIGAPVTGSKSPLIHRTSFAYNDIEATYEAFEVSPEELGEALEAFILKGYNGFNITIPHKESVMAFLDEVDPLAEKMGAVNTVVVKNGIKKGYNTDGLGFLTSLKYHEVEPKGLKVLILGAGGAAKGIVHALSMAEVARLDVFNRTKARASELSAAVRELYNIESQGYGTEDNPWVRQREDDLTEGMMADPLSADNLTPACSDYNLVINTTSVGMLPDTEHTPINPELFNKNTIFCDIVYKPHETLFLRRARGMGAKCIYGVEMLIFQALLSEQLWEEREIDLEGTKHLLFETEGLFK